MAGGIAIGAFGRGPAQTRPAQTNKGFSNAAVGKTTVNPGPTAGAADTAQPTADIFLPSASLDPTDDSRIAHNVLDSYMMVQYHVQLVLLRQSEALSVQQQRTLMQTDYVRTLRGRVAPTRATQNVVLARTGEVGTTESYYDASVRAPRQQSAGAPPHKNYYNIKSFRLENTLTPSVRNPLIRTMSLIKMKIAEPAGFNLVEDIRNIANSIGYTGAPFGRLLYRVDIWFAGFDPNRGAWVPQIAFAPQGTAALPGTQQTQVLSYYMAISNMEATVTNTGTEYEIDLTPAGHFAFRPEEIAFDAGSIFRSETMTFAGFLKKLSRTLSTLKANRTVNLIDRRFNFYAPAVLMGPDVTFRAGAVGRDFNFIGENQTNGGIVTMGQSIDLLTLLQAVLTDITQVQEFFVASQGNADFHNPRVHFALRFNTRYSTDTDPELNDYKWIEYDYIIEPFVTFKKGTVTMTTIDQYMDPQSQLARVQALIKYNMITRVYNYLFTGMNTEVLDFNAKFTAFYYETLNEASDQQEHTTGTRTHSAGATTNFRTSTLQQSVPTANNDQTQSPNDMTANRRMQQLFGSSRSTVRSSRNLSPYDRLGGGFNESVDNARQNRTMRESVSKSNYLTYLNDHLKYDLITIDALKVRGDPVWLLRPYANYDYPQLKQETAQANGVGGAGAITITPRSGRVIYIRMYAPNQDDVMNSTVARTPAAGSPGVLGGFYEVTQVVREFAEGKFVQTLQANKIANLNFVDDYLGTTPTGGISVRKATDSPLPNTDRANNPNRIVSAPRRIGR